MTARHRQAVLKRQRWVSRLTLGVSLVHANYRPGSRSSELPDECESRFLPILARILDLGRGPPELVMWVHWQLEAMNLPLERLESIRVAPILGQLACILARDSFG
jgi:hypothetical protein